MAMMPYHLLKLVGRVLTFALGSVLVPWQTGSVTGSLAGIVVDQEGKPIVNAVLTLESQHARGLSSQATISSVGGQFNFSDVPPGSYGLSAKKPGYLDGLFGRLRPEGPGQSLELARNDQRQIRIKLWRGATVSGRVTDEHGEPVVGVEVWASRTLVDHSTQSQAGRSRTDDRGQYRISELVPGNYVIAVEMTQVSYPEGLVRTVMSDRTSSSGRGIASQLARVGINNPALAKGLWRIGGWVWSSGSQFPTTAVPHHTADGRFVVYVSTYYPSVVSSVNAEIISLAAGEERRSTDLQLHASTGYQLRGRLSVPSGIAGGVALQLYRDDSIAPRRLATPAATTITDSDGSFQFMGLLAGAYRVRAVDRLATSEAEPRESGLRFWAEMPVTVGGDGNELLVVARAAPKVIGQLVVPPGLSTEGLSLRFNSTSGYPPTRTKIAQDGSFLVESMQPGRYQIALEDPRPDLDRRLVVVGRTLDGTAVELIDLPDRDTVRLLVSVDSRQTEVIGVVRDSSGRPDSTATVLAFLAGTSARADDGSKQIPVAVARVSESAEFVFRDSLQPGMYVFLAVPDETVKESYDTAAFRRLVIAGTPASLQVGKTLQMVLNTVTIR